MTPQASERANLTPCDAVRATVSFLDQLNLPIGVDRLHRSLIGAQLSLLDTAIAVDELVANGRLSQRDEMVCLAGREELFDHHGDNTRRAADTWPSAVAWAKRIGRVPFVRMVAVTGSLARDAVEAGDPIDLLIVVRPRRLWIARRLIARVVEAAATEGTLLRPVYITSTRTPEIVPPSVSIGWELTQLAVVIGPEIARTMHRSNNWIVDVFPNAEQFGNFDHALEQMPSAKQKWAETLLLLPPFRAVEHWTRKQQVARLRESARGQTSDTDPRHEHSRRFSSDICHEHLGLRADAADQTWTLSTEQS